MGADPFRGVLPFVRVAEARSFSRAAVSLGVTTAAVSKSIRALEEDLGVRLLERSSRVVRLTREGEHFLERCLPALRGIEGAREAMQGARREPRGELTVTLPFILSRFVVPSLPGLVAQYPRLSFRLELSDRIARLANEHFDVAVRMGDLGDSRLVARLLRKTRWATVAAPQYVARAGAPRTPDELATHNCLRFVGPSGTPREFAFAGGAARVQGNLLIDHGDALLDAAVAGLGVVQVLDFMVSERLRSGALVELLPSFSTEGPNIYAVSTEARARSANVRAFVRFLLESFARPA